MCCNTLVVMGHLVKLKLLEDAKTKEKQINETLKLLPLQQQDKHNILMMETIKLENNKKNLQARPMFQRKSV